MLFWNSLAFSMIQWMLCGFCQNHVMLSPSQYHTEQSHCPQNSKLLLLYLLTLPFFPRTPGNHGPVYWLHIFAFRIILCSWDHIVCSLFRGGFFHLEIRI